MNMHKKSKATKGSLTSLPLTAELTSISNAMSRYRSKVSETPLQFKHLTEIKENMNSKISPYQLLKGENTFQNKEHKSTIFITVSEKPVSKS